MHVIYLTREGNLLKNTQRSEESRTGQGRVKQRWDGGVLSQPDSGGQRVDSEMLMTPQSWSHSEAGGGSFAGFLGH